MTHAPIAGAYRLPPRGGRGAFQFNRGPVGRGGRQHTHQGIDLEAELGRPFLAIEAGTVERASNEPVRGFAGYGRHVVLLLDSGLRALYGHAAHVSVTRGQRVEEGAELGTVGQSQFRGLDPGDDNRMGAHLHFELSRARYPQGAETPTRIDPGVYLTSHGVPSSHAPELPEHASPPSSQPEPPPRPPARQMTATLRTELLRRMVATDIRVATAATLLERAGQETAGGILRANWRDARALIAPSFNNPTVEIPRELVSGWLAKVREARAFLLELPNAQIRRAGELWTAAQHELWTRGGWLIDSAERELREHVIEPGLREIREHIIDPGMDAARTAALGIGGVLLVVGVAYLATRGR